jgi:hypothetical protein
VAVARRQGHRQPLIVFFLAIFISIDRAAIGSFLLRLGPAGPAHRGAPAPGGVARSFGGFIRGMVVIGGTYALVALACNLALGLEYAALTTTASGILMAIPFFGPFVAWAPPVIVAAVTKPDALLPALAIMGVGWFITQNVIQPRILAGAVGLHPVVVLASVCRPETLQPGAMRPARGGRHLVVLLLLPAPVAQTSVRWQRGHITPRARRTAGGCCEPRPGEAEEIEDEWAGRPVAPRGGSGGPTPAAPRRGREE